MKVIYDSETDTLGIILRDATVVESDEDKASGSFVTKIAIVYAQEMAMSMPNDPLGMIFDYDALGNIVSLEILDASQRVLSPIQIEYQVLTPAVV